MLRMVEMRMIGEEEEGGGGKNRKGVEEKMIEEREG